VATTKTTLGYASVFYKETGTERHNLIKLISSHSLWQKTELWERIIEGAINEEIVSHDIFNYAQKEEDRRKLVGNIVFCQLGATAEIMKQFGLNTIVAAELIQKFVGKYELTAGDAEVLMTTIRGKKEKEVSRVLTVQRGIPAWLQELETPTAAAAKRTPKTLVELLNNDKTQNSQ
jgi:hypothetical protein